MGGTGVDLAYSCLWADTVDMGTLITSAVPALSGEFEPATQLLALSASYAF